MKKITELEKTIEPIDVDAKEPMPTYRKIIQLVVANSKTRTADDSRRVARIIPKIKTGNEAELSDEEFMVLKGLIESNQANLTSYIHGVLLEKIDPSKG